MKLGTRTIRTKIMTMTTSSEPIHCRSCGELLWVQVVDPDGKACILIGSMKVSVISGTCWVCGEEYHWRPEDVRFEILTRKGIDS